MKNLILLLLLFTFPPFVFSQEFNRVKPLPEPSYIITASTFIGYGSTNVTNEFANKLVFGGHISKNLKDRVLAKTKSTNRMGSEINYEFKFYNLKDTFLTSLPNYRYYFGFGSFKNTSAKFSADFYKIMFYGNKDFVGKTAHLGNTTLFESSFKKISIGLTNISTNTSFAISIISGDKHNYYNFKTADFKTASNAQEINVAYKGKTQKSDSIGNGFLSFSGAGVALDFSTQIKNKLILSVTNLGFAVWNRNPSQVSFNETYTFDGFYIDNIFSQGEFNINKSIDSITPKLKSKAFTELLPAIFEVNNVINPNKKMQLIYGARYKMLSNYFPLIYTGGLYQFSNVFSCATAITYGGYNTLEGNLSLRYKSNNLHVGVGTNNLIGNLSKNGFGKSVYLSLKAIF